VLPGLAMLLGLGAPLLVATDVVQPIALSDEPGLARTRGEACAARTGRFLPRSGQRTPDAQRR
jgi:hypothetical protein